MERAEGGQIPLEMEEVNMYVLFARMFAHIAREVELACGERGIEAVRAGARSFGEERGRHIAARALAKGHAPDAGHYLSCYDMGRSGYFHSSDKVSADSVEQDFDKCIFAETWIRDGCQRWGIHYCEMIDPAIAQGYHKDFTCIHDKHFFEDGRCHFQFIMEKEKGDKSDD
ncbi:MAG: L-2-amino-thiazoline-4-carboxylic acid hydrolase [Provencibacterium sp.]|jgi:hypothetical protein|nr:L-2-amino-thiazoline-4-carboxylic acid hydrolase [Provencibacterium sp.]